MCNFPDFISGSQIITPNAREGGGHKKILLLGLLIRVKSGECFPGLMQPKNILRLYTPAGNEFPCSLGLFFRQQ